MDNRGNDTYPSEIANCSFIGNEGTFGGALQIDDTTNCGYLVLRNNRFLDNYAVVGGAIFYDDNADGGVMLIDSCHFENNFAENLSGAVEVTARDDFQGILIKNCTFINNSCGIGIPNAQGVGGAIGIVGSNTRNDNKPRPRVLENCIFIGNKAKKAGALFTTSTETIVKNCLFANNFSETDGGAYFIPNLRGMNEYNIINCTFVGNQAQTGGAIRAIKFFQDEGERNTLNLINCLFQNNKAENNADVAMVYFDADFRHCLFSDASDCESVVSIFEGYEDFLSWSCFGNIYAQDALFRDTTNADFRLFACSPAVDGGTTTIDINNDLDGNERQIGARVDIGAYEFVHQEIEPLNAEFDVINATNEGELGSINISSVTGAYPPYSYQVTQGEAVFGIFDLPVGEYELQIIDSEQCRVVFPFSIEVVSSTENLSESSISLFPNPSRLGTAVFLSMEIPSFTTISIFDDTGRLISQESVISSKKRLSLPSLSGIYFVRVTNEYGSILRKVVLFD